MTEMEEGTRLLYDWLLCISVDAVTIAQNGNSEEKHFGALGEVAREDELNFDVNFSRWKLLAQKEEQQLKRSAFKYGF